jgi:predicted TIM-barrel fold metal-dependent hydrolase
MTSASAVPLSALPASAVRAVDVHGHYGRALLRGDAHLEKMLSGDAALVAGRAMLANIEWTVVSPLLGLFPRGQASAAAGNDQAFDVVPRTPGLRQWVIVNPLEPKTYEQAETMLKAPWCVGIKIHPEEHVYPIAEQGRAIFEFAARHRAVVLTHTGGAHSEPMAFVPFANEFPETKLILAHLGHMDVGDNRQQVLAIQASRHGNVFTDTSSSKSIMSGLIEWAVREVGADRILFGTDTPLYFAAMQRMRVEQAEISPANRLMILSGNARKLLKL